MAEDKKNDFLEEPKDIEMPPESDLGANENVKAKPKASLNKKPIAQAIFLIVGAAFALGGLLYLKISNSKEKSEDLGVIASPVANPNANSPVADNRLAFGSVSDVPAAPPAPQPAAASDAQQQTQLDEAEIARKNQEKAMLEARYKSSVMVTGNSALSPNSEQQEGGQMPAELQNIFGSLIAQQGSGKGGGSVGQHEETSAASTMGGRFNSGTSQAPIASASYNPNRALLIQQGKVIDAVLETAIKSDMPMQIIARVSEPVYGEQGRYELLPAGTRLFGEYSSVVKAGQTEVAAIWRRAITPQGVEIMLDSPSTNNLGIAGMGGKVNNHFFRIFSTAALLSVFGAATATVDVKGSDNNNSAAQYRAEVAHAFNDTSQNMLSKHADIQPTITVKHGTQIKILVAKDLDFSSLLN